MTLDVDSLPQIKFYAVKHRMALKSRAMREAVAKLDIAQDARLS